MNWSIVGHSIEFQGGQKLRFDFDIKEGVEVNGVLVVVLDVPSDRAMTENVFGISTDGRRLWQIERIPSTATDPVNRYVEVVNHSTGVASIGNWNGVVVDIDVQTGKVLRQRFGK